MDHLRHQDTTQEHHNTKPVDRTDVGGRLLSGIRRIVALGEEPLYGVQATREIEVTMASALPPFELMTRAGDSVARIARAIAPHARRIWIACGPGNNGGDGLVAARRLIEDVPVHHRPPEVCVTLCGDPDRLPADAARALAQALTAGLTLAPHPPAHCDLVIDALLGIGVKAAPQGVMHEQLVHMHRLGVPVLCVDLPSGLLADTGEYLGPAAALASAARHTLALLTLKPGLFTADGRDQAGTVWLDTLGSDTSRSPAPTAILRGVHGVRAQRPHASHKGLQGDVVVVGGQGIAAGAGMTGAAVLAARAALHAGAGRVYLGLLEDRDGATTWDPGCPELMFRRLERLLEDLPLLQRASVVCGCGGGSALAASLPRILSACPTLVLDADALNAVSGDAALRTLLTRRHVRGWITVLTPHPLEAARLLGLSTREVMKDRLSAARLLSQSMGAITVLKGSGSVVQAPGEVPCINASGNAALATAGTGDVLAGWIGAALARGTDTPATAVLDAVFRHGQLADRWVSESDQALTADRLATGIPRLW